MLSEEYKSVDDWLDENISTVHGLTMARRMMVPPMSIYFIKEAWRLGNKQAQNRIREQEEYIKQYVENKDIEEK